MMGAFLDALGIAHENGVIQEDDVKPDEAKLAPAVDAIEKAYPPEDVSLYLNVLLCQDPGDVGRPPAHRRRQGGARGLGLGISGSSTSNVVPLPARSAP